MRIGSPTSADAPALQRCGCLAPQPRGEERPDSDVDLIADFGAPIGFFELLRAEGEIAEFFGRPVDLLTEPALSPFMRDALLDSAMVIFDGTS